jgi:uncharacterized PurR-regulated membrane protein YhhQ (DUF165 family)
MTRSLLLFWSKYVDHSEVLLLLVSQLIDVTVFGFQNKTGNNKIWLRALSTVISQLFDSFIVLGIALVTEK